MDLTQTYRSRFSAQGPDSEPESSLPSALADSEGERSHGQMGRWYPLHPSSRGQSLSDQFEVVPRLVLKESRAFQSGWVPPYAVGSWGSPKG